MHRRHSPIASEISSGFVHTAVLFCKVALCAATKLGSSQGQLCFCQGRGNRSNEIPRTWHQGQLKERAGLVVSRSLTLNSPSLAELIIY